ncbi:hypothetical protein FGG08_007616, partial [Glutinoglossum americanum]
SEIGDGGPYDLCAAGRYWCWDAAFWSARGDGRMLREQLDRVASQGATEDYVMGERYDMDHVYYVDGSPWHGAAHYYEYPCVFSWVLFTEYLGLRPALDADLLISPRLEAHGEVTLQQSAYQLRYSYTTEGFTLENLGEDRSFRLDLRALYPGAKQFRLPTGEILGDTPIMLGTGDRITLLPKRQAALRSQRQNHSASPVRKAVLVCVFAGFLLPLLAACSGLTPAGFGGVARPRLENGEAERRGPVINEAAFNNAAIQATLAPYSGFVGQVRVNYDGERNVIANDLNDLGSASADFDPNETVSVDFTDAPLSFILEQLLRGALRVDFIAPDELPTGITFRIETPLPKSRVIQVVRDLLARQGLVMRLINGVYQIGSADLIQALQANSNLGRPGDDTTKVIDLGTNNATQVVAIASQLLPQDVSVMVSSSSDKVVVRANQNDIASVEAMLRQLSQMAVGSDQVAIVPLRRSAPEAVAAQLSQFYGDLIGEGSDARVSIIPLQNQQAILVGTSDPALMRGVQQLAQQLDRSVTDASELRVVALTHRKAVELVPQLVQLFGSTAALPAPTETAAAGPTTGVLSPPTGP